MPYAKQTWQDKNPTYPLSAARMGVIEQGIFDAAAVADQGHRILTTAQKNALTGVVAGTEVFDSTLGQMQRYNGSAWVGQSGLVPIIPTSYNLSGGSAVANTSSLISFSAVSSVSLNGAFSSLYQNYRIILRATQSATGAFYIRLRASGADDTGANYWYSSSNYTTSGTTVTVVGGSANQADTYGNATGGKAMSIDVFDPFVTTRTFASFLQFFEYTGSALNSGFGGFSNSQNAALDGITVYPGGGTITGSIRVYGYANQ